MQKTKFGISVGMLGAIVFFLALFGGYLAVTIAVGYVMLFEQNEWLKKGAIKAITLMIVLAICTAVLNLIPNAINVINNFVSIFGGSFSLNIVDNTIKALVSVINIIEKLLFLGLGLKAFNQGTIAVPIVDKMIEKYMG